MTDHAAEAREALDAWGIVPLPAPGTDEQEVARQSIAVAQVHATLALADEQRTANLIALYASAGTPTTVEGVEQRMAVEDDILARLGLTPTTPNQEQ